MGTFRGIWLLVFIAIAAGCATPASAPAPGSTQPSSSAEGGRSELNRSRVLQVITRGEPNNLSLKFPTAAAAGTNDAVKRLFNAYLALEDERQTAHPYLAEALPQLNTDTWRVFPDGRMETTYRLRPGLTWHDGAPLAAEDFAFALRIYKNGALGFRPSPQDLMEDVVAADPLTVVIRWNRLYPEAGALVGNSLPPLPRHILESAYREDAPEAFLNHAYWTTEYVGLGPYRLTRWEPGAFLEGVAYGGHQPSAARIERVRVNYTPDPNTVVASLLAKAGDIAVDDSIRFQHGALLRRQWEGDRAGVVLSSPNVTRYMQVQYRPDVVSTPALLDVRVRRALLHAIDRPTLVDALLEGQGDVAETMISNQMSYYPAVDRSIARYPYDTRRTEQLMDEAGYPKRGDFFVNGAGDRLSPVVRSLAGGQEEQELAILVDGLRRAGFDASSTILSVAQSRDGEAQATFTGLNTAQTVLPEDTVLVKFLSARTPGPANRWAGSNLGGYSNTEYDRLYDLFNTTLDRSERDQIMVRLSTFINDELPGLPLYYNPRIVAHAADLRGPRAGGDTFNVQEWEFR